MRIPSAPKLLPKQRTAGRFFETDEMMDVLAVYYGGRSPIYPRTWQYRTLIALHRSQNSTNMYRKGYGADWLGLRREEQNGAVVWVLDVGSHSIKREVLEYARTGRLPLVGLQKGAELVRAAEMQAVVALRVESLLEEPLEQAISLATH